MNDNMDSHFNKHLKVSEALDRKNLVSGVFVDIQKAFDTVDHNILLSKLEYYGIRGPKFMV